MARLGLLALILTLVLVLAWQWHDWPPPAPGPSEARSTLSAAEASPSPAEDPRSLLLPLDDKGKYENIMQRPLFLLGRRPPKEAPAPEAPVEPQPPSDLARLNLNAVLITPSESSAWVQDPAQQALVRLRLGDEFEGWSVHEIRSDRVLLERQGEKDTLVLRDYKNQPPPWKKPTARKQATPSPRTVGKGLLQEPRVKQPHRKPSAETRQKLP